MDHISFTTHAEIRTAQGLKRLQGPVPESFRRAKQREEEDEVTQIPEPKSTGELDGETTFMSVIFHLVLSIIEADQSHRIGPPIRHSLRIPHRRGQPTPDFRPQPPGQGHRASLRLPLAVVPQHRLEVHEAVLLGALVARAAVDLQDREAAVFGEDGTYGCWYMGRRPVFVWSGNWALPTAWQSKWSLGLPRSPPQRNTRW